MIAARNGGQMKILFTGAERKFVSARFPAEFLNKQFRKTAALQQWAGALEIKCHRLIFADAK
jgi:hypothetical protein